MIHTGDKFRIKQLLKSKWHCQPTNFKLKTRKNASVLSVDEMLAMNLDLFSNIMQMVVEL